NKGWAYGVYSGIHTITGGDTTIIPSVQQISNEIPAEFTLCQNYPNPFNPVTNIIYELRIKSNVRLEVYDLTGKLVQTLVNKEQPAGTYQYTFDGNRLTSGVYFYKLQTDNFMDTKKMI